MADETDDPEIAASRLEAALERIAQHAAVPQTTVQPKVETAEIAERLDSLIDRLRGALASK
jgi:hypothetical protein